MIMVYFLIEDKNEKSQFFEEIFLLTNFSIDIILYIFFLILNNIKINFIS